MSRPMGRHRARRDTGIHALRRPAVAATAAISSVSVAAAAYSTAASASASVAGTAQANIALGAPAQTSTALQAANAAVATNSQAQVAAANRAVNARAAADARTRSAVAARATSAAKLRSKAAASAKAAVKADAAKKAAAKAAAAKAAAAKRVTPPATSRSSAPSYSGSPQTIASAMLGSYGWGQDQMGCLISLWNRESGWNVYAANPSSGAYGIPQSLPGYKMASAGADWRTNPATQIRWGLGYIRSTYGSPCGAWGHSQATGWY